MRILTFIHSFEPGGVERIALRLVRRWRELGVEAPLFVGRTDGAMADDVGTALDIIVPPRRWIGIAHWETLWMILTLPRAVRATRPDMIFCAGNTYALSAVILKLTLGRRCPPIVAKISNNLDRHDAPWLQRAAYGWWLRLQGRHIDHFVGMEVPMRGEIGEVMKVSPARVSIVPDPALSETMIARARRHPRRHADPAHGRRFVTIGRLAPQKNIALMLRAFARASRADDRLTLFGDGPERARLEALTDKLGIADRVDFRGYVAEPAAVLHQFDILLLSSDYEGVPAVVLEALAADIAIVATNCSRSMPVLLKGGALGTLVEVGDEAMFADAIAGARPGTQDPVLSLDQAGRFTIESAADAYLSVMTPIARGERSVRAGAPVRPHAADVTRNGYPESP